MASNDPVYSCQGSDGNTYHVRRGFDRNDGGPPPGEPAAAFDSLWTTDGKPVQYVCKGHYHLEGSSVELTTDDPTAP